MKYLKSFIIILFIMTTLHCLADNELRTWTARNGQQIEASFIKMQESSVVLKKHDGSLLKINRSQLISADQKYLKEITTPKNKGPHAGTVTFEVQTISTGKVFAPRHVCAIWVTDQNDNFVKTLECNAKHFAKHLKKWRKQSKNNVIDAVTSASLKKHKTHKVIWDCKDTSGKIVKDGVYKIHVEFTEKNGAGPYTPKDYIKFTKGAKPYNTKLKPLKYFKQIALTYTPIVE